MTDTLTLDEALAELCSAEDFLDYFGVPYDEAVVRVNRLHILQRYHDYLARLGDVAGDDGSRAAVYKQWLSRAYEDFVHSDSLTEKVFRVFHTQALPEGGSSQFVSLDRIFQPR